ncbi:uncharacterized protein EAF02_006391 [Botrytis sinoallii]|uniref:uncharacterized protein n=1 Tax=Botrytis sinoallii TaxID=1463999 RepID=UPI001900D79E|nr:uncharacterized protein EAF02_006391 [Botrytis sinoallii]KAF7881703.1 hypothetical protein EAF02_006391 [Botrytis sinoallii]
MNSTSPIDTIEDGTNEAASEWAHQNGDSVIPIEKKLDTSMEYPTRPLMGKRKAKRKDDSPLDIICRFIVDHQTGLSVNLLMLLSLTHMCFPRARRHTRKFFELSYYNPESGEYCAGWNDAWLVFYWVVIFTGLRAAFMDYVLRPLARKGGVKTARDETRFAEQAWLMIYYSVFWTLGMYIYVNSDYWWNLSELWTNWPNREVGGLRKWYILVQYAFWLQQIIVINIEARRKDHWQMFTHHIVTTALIFTSYGYHQTKVANVILCLMDVVDLFFPVAKCLKYLGYDKLCDFMFGLFMLSWVMARHVFYLIICYSVWADIPRVINYGCYQGKNGSISGPFPPPDRFGHLFKPFQDPVGVVCWNNNIKWGFLGALLFLQGITLMWFWMIVKVAIKVIRGGQADDTRSDNEEEEEEDIDLDDEPFLEEVPLLEKEPYEEEVGVEELNLEKRTSKNSRYKKTTSSASGVSIPGHSDRKELLGRIGCDKGV